jgi:hypothetical protein
MVSLLAVMQSGEAIETGIVGADGLHITILNRDGLEECACECYSVIRAETDKLMGAA